MTAVRVIILIFVVLFLIYAVGSLAFTIRKKVQLKKAAKEEQNKQVEQKPKDSTDEVQNQ